jgi:hypothetical protein
MAFSFIQDVPANEEMYRKIRDLLPSEVPSGLIAHVAARRSGGLRYVDVWESEADWNRFRDVHLEPVVEKVLAEYGIPHSHDDVKVEALDVIDVWRGGS